MAEELAPKEAIAGPVDDKETDEVRFDYDAEAELFPGRNRRAKSRPGGYKRFVRAADAIRFAIEELTPEFLSGACLEVDEVRFDGRGIRRLYDSTDYPLGRRTLAQ